MSTTPFSKRNHQEYPRFDKGRTFLWAERVRISREKSAITMSDQRGVVDVPAALLSVLMVGPGTTITHGAIELLSLSGCSVLWMGEGGTRCYAAGFPDTERSTNLERQVELWADIKSRTEVVRRMYSMRFGDGLSPKLTIQQIRGHEGVRVREAYAEASRKTGIKWTGRLYKNTDWDASDPVNRALSVANACLYGLVHGAIVSTGFSPSLGFIHSGKRLSFVYDIADLYKADITVPIAFTAAASNEPDLEGRVRRACRNAFFQHRLITRLVPDLQRVLGMKEDTARLVAFADPFEEGLGIWDPDEGLLVGGRNWAEDEEIVMGGDL